MLTKLQRRSRPGKIYKGDWKLSEFKETIWPRTVKAFSNKLILCGITIILSFGGLGVWKEIAYAYFQPESSSWSDVTSALIVFYPVLITLSGMELMVLQKSGAITKAIIYFIILVVVVITMILMFLEYLRISHGILLIMSIFFSLLGIWLWGFVNIESVNYGYNFNDAVGGELDKVLKGKTEGYTT